MEIPSKSSMRHLGQEVYTDETLVYKFGNDYQKTSLDSEVRALERVQGISHTQVLVDYLSDENVLITELAKGSHLDIESEAFRTGNLPYNSTDLEQLFGTLLEMKDKGVVFEAHAKNLLYSTEAGFTPIDYNIPILPSIRYGALLDILTLQNIPGDQEVQAGLFTSRKSLSHPAIDKESVENEIVEAFKAVDFEEATVAVQNYYENKLRITRENELNAQGIGFLYGL